MLKIKSIVLAWVVVGTMLSGCAQAEGDLVSGEDGLFESVLSALTVRIQTDDGAVTVRLAEIDSLDDAAIANWLETTLSDHQVYLAYGGLQRDRYDRALAHMFVDLPDGRRLWVQQELVSAGWARVMSYPDNRARAVDLLRSEIAAREAGRGAWTQAEFRIRDTHPDALAQWTGSVQLIEGRVLDVAELNNGRVYLNFGADYRTDFTIVIDETDRALFDDVDLPALLGQRVRVRGLVRDRNGPMIRLDHPERLEILGH